MDGGKKRGQAHLPDHETFLVEFSNSLVDRLSSRNDVSPEMRAALRRVTRRRRRIERARS